MKLLELDLLAFGKFTGARLDLSQGAAGLHVVYGANEAGKSTTLRAVQGLLFGVPERSRDGFLHDNRNIRIAGRIRANDGRELAFQRRKGRVKTLLDSDGLPLETDVLDPFLGGISEDLFSTVFGIDHERLQQGARVILEGGGEVGGSLFSAASGGADIRRILDELDSEANGLFRSQGRNPSINRALTEYRALRDEIKAVSLSSRDWKGHADELASAEARRGDIVRELQRLMSEKDRIASIARSLAGLSRRSLLMERIGELEGVVVLADDFAERRRHTTAALGAARLALETSRSKAARLRERADGLETAPQILEKAKAIGELHQRLGGQHKAVADRIRHRADMARLEADAEALLKDVRPDLGLEQVDELRLTVAQRRRVQEIVSRYGRVAEACERAEQNVAELERESREVDSQLSELGDPVCTDELVRAVGAAQRKGDLEEARRRIAAELDVELGQADVERGRLNPPPQNAEDLESVAWPLAETVAAFDDTWRRLAEDRTRDQARVGELKDKLQDLDRKIDQLAAAGDLPRPADLRSARQRRDDLWRTIRSIWLEELAPAEVRQDSPPNDVLAGAFEDHLGRADEIADRLRREASRVAEMAELQSARGRRVEDLTETEARLQALHERTETVESDWRSLWAPTGIDPRTPREMREWLTLKDGLLQRAERCRRMQGDLGSVEETITVHRKALGAALRSVGKEGPAKDEELGPLLDRCATVVQHLNEAQRRREALEQNRDRVGRAIEEATVECARARDALEGWRAEFADAVGTLGLSNGASPGEALAVLGKLEELVSRVDERGALERQVDAIEEEIDAFEEQVNTVVATVACDLQGLDVETAVVRLHERVSRATAAAAERNTLEEQVRSLEDEAAEAEQTIALMESRVDELCREAECRSADELGERERLSNELLDARAALQTVEEQLVEHSGMQLGRLLREAEHAEPARFEMELGDLERHIGELEDERAELDRHIGRERQILAGMDGGDQAAVLAEQAAAKRSEIGRLVERYQRLRLARSVLDAEVERYRAENQGPLLRRAGRLFSKLTLGSFRGLEAAFDEHDRPILEGVRGDGSKVGVDGMSDGTRDQLFLALRLATLEKLVEVGEALPFVVDDILVGFDDERARAALEVLADLSSRIQVLFFTHHRRLTELAVEAAGDRVFLHEIPV